MNADAATSDELPRNTVFAAMAGVMAAMFMSALDQTIVGTAMPRIIADLHGFAHYAGVITAYMVASTVAVPIVGKLSDIYGRKPFLLTGVAAFVAASVACGAAQSMTQLIVFRGLQGLGAGFTQAMAFTTIADLFPPARRGRVSGLMGSVFGLSSVIGPAIGGFLTDGPGWRYVFYVNLPVGGAAFAILLFFFPKLPRPEGGKPKIDYLGALTLVLSVVPVLLALSWGGRDYPWDSPLVIGLGAVGSLMTVVFLWVELKSEAPMIPIRLFKDRVVWTCMGASSLVSVGLFGTTLFIPLFIQSVIGTSATKSGAVMMPMTFALIASSMTTGQIIMHLGKYRMLAIFGVAVAALGEYLLSTMSVDTGYGQVVAYMIVMGVGLGATMPIFTLAVQNAVSTNVVGSATSTVQFVRSVGGAIGAAMFGSLLANLYVPMFRAALPADALAQIPADVLAKFDNPRILMTQDGLAGVPMVDSLKQAARVGLATSLHQVFFTASLLMGLGVVIVYFLQDRPLRKSNRPVAVPPPE